MSREAGFAPGPGWGASTPTVDRCQLSKGCSGPQYFGGADPLARGPKTVNPGLSLPGAVNRWRIDPADIAVGPAVDDVHPAAAAMLEYHACGAGQIELDHRLADRKPAQRRGRFGNNHGAV